MHTVPGLLMYMWIGLCASSDCKYNSWATITLEYSSDIWKDRGHDLNCYDKHNLFHDALPPPSSQPKCSAQAQHVN